MRKLFNPFTLMLIILVLVGLGCQATGGDTGSTDSTDPKVLLSDDFSKESSGWDRHSGDEGSTDYYLDAYRIQITNQPQYYLWANPNKDLGSDVIVEVDAAVESGSQLNDIGIICRYTDADNFYFLTISSDGYYGVSKFFNGEESLVGATEQSQNTSAIKSGSESNHIQASCIGSEMVLTVNGTELTRVQDTDITAGDVGLLAGTYDEGDLSVMFDNFKVTAP